MLTYADVCSRWEEMRSNLGAADANTRKRELQTIMAGINARRCAATVCVLLY